MNTTLCEAIRNQNVVEFYYDGGQRVVEPFCHGVSTAGNEVLRGYQRSGFSRSGTVPDWKLFRLDGINGLTVSRDTFSSDRAGYNPNDSAMDQIFCCV